MISCIEHVNAVDGGNAREGASKISYIEPDGVEGSCLRGTKNFMLKPVGVGVTKVTPELKQTDMKNNEKPKTGNSGEP